MVETKGRESLVLAIGPLITCPLMVESLDAHKAANFEKENVAGDNSAQGN